jgi:hypothetical protein
MNRPYNVIRINGHIVPATYHDAIKKILHGVQTGRILASAHGKYRVKRGMNPSCMCAIGTFFTDAQLDEITIARRNGMNTRQLSEAIGQHNFEAMTGLDAGFAGLIQSDFDNFAYAGRLITFSDRLRKMLATTKNRPNPATAHTGAWHFPVSGA